MCPQEHKGYAVKTLSVINKRNSIKRYGVALMFLRAHGRKPMPVSLETLLFLCSFVLMFSALAANLITHGTLSLEIAYYYPFPDARRVAPIRGSVWCLSTVLLAIICKCTNTADAVALLFATLRRQPISILAHCHISTLPCSHHFALSLSASWSSYCFCRRTSSFIKRAVIFSVPDWP